MATKVPHSIFFPQICGKHVCLYHTLKYPCVLCVCFWPFPSDPQVHYLHSATLVFRASLAAQLIKNRLAMQETLVDSWVRMFPWRREKLPTPVFLGFLVAQTVKNLPTMRGNLGSIPGLERSPGGGYGNPLQYSCLENLHGQDPGALQSMGSQSWTRLSD